MSRGILDLELCYCQSISEAVTAYTRQFMSELCIEGKSSHGFFGAMAIKGNTAQLIVAYSYKLVCWCAILGPNIPYFPEIYVGLVKPELRSEYVGSTVESTGSASVFV